jgi:hypothetical protein
VGNVGHFEFLIGVEKVWLQNLGSSPQLCFTLPTITLHQNWHNMRTSLRLIFKKTEHDLLTSNHEFGVDSNLALLTLILIYGYFEALQNQCGPHIEDRLVHRSVVGKSLKEV